VQITHVVNILGQILVQIDYSRFYLYLKTSPKKAKS